ncbi:aminotransferase class IV [Streptomyces sp. NPDC056144]|uniref:aminotransferase class IV n=1 Tax=unclassified Streptomyces TaxID=2593676 RepID=UPI0035D70A8E
MTTPPTHPPYIEIDGTPAPDPDLLTTLMSGFGHFTAFQVRDGRFVKGLGLHLERLDRSTRELFGRGLAGAEVRARVAGAVAAAGRRDCSARVYVYEGARIAVVVADPAADTLGAPQRLMSVEYLRPAPHLKHLGGFGQHYHRAAAFRAGYDEALLTSGHGEIAEAAVSNIAFWDGVSVVWPTAPQLSGVTMTLLEPLLGSTRKPVSVTDLKDYRAAFVANARGIAPVSGVDTVDFAVDAELMERVGAAYASVEPEEILPSGPSGSPPR